MINLKKYRNNGAVGALLDEYEKSIDELKAVIATISTSDLTKIVDEQTKDEDCKSIQSVLSHVIGSGYTYVVEIKKWLGEEIDYISKQTLHSTEAYIEALEKMFIYNEKLFQDFPTLKLEEYDSSKKIHVRWGQTYDVEQLLEHAIVHVLRHRRQIEKMHLKIKVH